ncbi:threonine synthase [Caproiciproducens sp. MSJ-32]|uniref:threonine synthase n=1 Tax=Caproiciproducens sp. MSJ-32 TaxID=2841527 RepID=UPI001C12944F|nr:threonine synthase [Caproiciproducens sp. MSJ-32]MBU5454694.1 threonine synthase [Caproiciproducens sp. MSJ-32]
MRYISTRNENISVSPSQAIIQGISRDGGLFVPLNIPKISLDELKNLNYKDLAFEIMSKFFTDFEERELRECIKKAYDDKFDTELIAPLVKLGEDYCLELYHGPTLAFKDMALSILPYLLKQSLKINGENKEVVILTATSGDTGKAALEGFAKVDGIKIIVFFPEEGVSKIQKLQMRTQEGENTYVVGINGNFDDAQGGVKAVFNDKEFVEFLNKNNYILSSANSINIGRLIPQVVYYFYSYLLLVRDNQIKLGDKINFVVPTGNFGNILAAYYAKKMGLPINKLICASNENKVLTDFFDTGIYDKRRELILTSSPSMDILISSNLERLLYHLDEEREKLTALCMEQLSEMGFYKIDKDILGDFYGGYSSEEEVADTIKKVYKRFNYLLDTHTAVAYNVSEKYKKEYKEEDIKTIIISTASPYKFPASVASSIGLDIRDRDEFELIDILSKETNMAIPKTIKNLKEKKNIHNHNCNKEDMRKMIEKFLKVGGNND